MTTEEMIRQMPPRSVPADSHVQAFTLAHRWVWEPENAMERGRFEAVSCGKPDCKVCGEDA